MDDGIAASTGRKILSWIIDYFFYDIAWSLLIFITGPFVESGNFVLSLIVFVLLRGLLGQIAMTPGKFLLSIDEAGYVDEEIFDREGRLTILIGVLLIWSGTVSVWAWTLPGENWPQFGFVPDPVENMVLLIVGGVLSTLAGSLILKVQSTGHVLGLMIGGLSVLSTVMSWHLFEDFIVDYVYDRRAEQGLSMRDGEAEFLLALIPEGELVISLLLIGALLMTIRRFATPRAQEPL